MPNIDINWILEEKIRVAKNTREGNYLVESLSTPDRPSITISTSPEGRMLFNGEDIETEYFMGFIGLLDAVNEWYDATNNPYVDEPL